MDKLFGDLKNFFNVKKRICVIDSFVFRLHYRFTLVVLLAFSIAVSGKAYVGDPISCISKDDIPEDLLNTYCWVTATFSVVSAWKKEVGKEIPYPGVDKYTPGEKRVYHAYYQWVAFVLFLQAMLFYVPRYVWRNAEHKRMRDLVMDFYSPVFCADPGEDGASEVKDGDESKKDEKGDEKGSQNDDSEKASERGSQDDDSEEGDGKGGQNDGTMQVRIKGDEEEQSVKEEEEKKEDPKNVEQTKLLLDYLEYHKHKHTFYGAMYTVATVLNFVNVVGQMYLMDAFLGGEFTSYGTEVISFTEWDYSSRYDPMIKVFPRMTKCTFYRYGSSGDPQKHDAMCLLSINILNEKIYVFIWFWFVILATLSGFEMVYRAAILLSRDFRYYALHSRCKTVDEMDLKTVVKEYDRYDWLVLSLLCKNMTPRNFRIIITAFSRRILHRKIL